MQNFYGKRRRPRRRVTWEAGVESGPPIDKLVSNMESSFSGHTVDALVLTGDEGRDKLR